METNKPMTVQCGGITLIQADCMDVLQDIPDKAFDLAIVDPPYGLHIDGQKQQICKNPKHNRKYHANKGWDRLPPPRKLFYTIGTCVEKPNHLGCELFRSELAQGIERLDCVVQRSTRFNNVRL